MNLSIDVIILIYSFPLALSLAPF